MNTIVILNKLFPYECGGAEKFILDFAQILANHNYTVHFLTPQTDKNIPKLKNIHFHFIPSKQSYMNKRLSYLFKGYKHFNRLIKETSPDLIIDNISPIPFYPLYTTKFSGKKVSIIHAILRKKVFKLKDGIPLKIATFLAEESIRFINNTQYIVVSKSTQVELSKLNPKKDIKIIENSFDPFKFNYTFKEDLSYVLCLTRLSKRKGVKHLLYAWKELNIDIPLKIAGNGPEKDNLIRLKNKLKLNNVEFLGYVSEKEKINLLEKASLYVLPTLGEGFGISNLEAMAIGTPVVSCDVLGVKDYIIHGKNGLLARPEDSSDLANQIKLALLDTSLRKKLSKNARKTAERFTIDNTKGQIIDFMDTIYGGEK